MFRTSKVTFTAAAVTLVCVSGAVYASPVVIAESMGSKIETFAPLEYNASSRERPSTTMQAHEANEPRQESTIINNGTWEATEPELDATTMVTDSATAIPSGITTAAGGPSSPDRNDTIEPTESETGRITSEIPNSSTTPAPSPTNEESETPEDLDSPDSVTVIVNKLRPLPSDFEPEDLVELPSKYTDGRQQQLREEAAQAAEDMFAAAEQDEIDLHAVSSFRTFDYQQRLYDNYLQHHGTADTEGMSARPGHSEHQTGLALDVDTAGGEHTLQTSFGDTDAGRWIAEHAHEYGFVIRYPEEQHDITGFQYEPWHLRYFGEQYSQRIEENSGVAEEEFGLDPAPDYQE